MTSTETARRGTRPGEALKTPTDLTPQGVAAITGELRQLLADVFALYVKTKNFHWHMSGPHFRDYHLLLDEHSEQIFAMTDDIAERARKIGGTTILSIGDIARHQRLRDNDGEFTPRAKCWPNSPRTTNCLREACGPRTPSATSTRTSPPPA